jgi:hypothetical protein
LDKSKAHFRRLQNSPSAQTVVIADLNLRQALFAKTLSMAAQMDAFWATGHKVMTSGKVPGTLELARLASGTF